MAKRLRELKVVEISLVDRPANKRPLLLLRSADEMAERPTLTIPEELLPELRKAVESGRLAAMLKGDHPMKKCPECGAEMSPEDTEKGACPKCKASLKAQAEKADKENAMDKAAFEALTKAHETAKAQLEELAKAHAETKAALAEVTKKAAEAEVKLAAETAERQRRDAVAKVAKHYPSLDQAKVVSQILKAEGRGKEDVEELDAILKQAEALAKAGTTEIGTSADGAGGDAWAKIEAAAVAMVAKGSEKLTQAQAIAKFLETPEGRDLHRQYRAAQQ